MNTSIYLLMSATLVATGVHAAQDMPELSPQTRTGHLQCGDVQLTAQTQYIDVPDHDRQVLAQILKLSVPGKDAETTLAHDGRFFKQAFLKHTLVLDASATGWACLTSSKGKPYVYVSYTCIESKARPACVGTTREWARIFDTSGKLLNSNYPRSGPRTPALMKKLGLGRHLSEGVDLRDIDE